MQLPNYYACKLKWDLKWLKSLSSIIIKTLGLWSTCLLFVTLPFIPSIGLVGWRLCCTVPFVCPPFTVHIGVPSDDAWRHAMLL